ncbi:hypothetical protein HDV05_002243 [Chytridiales sp. JEL 0842]|nr:hypothetical protein HDV05_002243 [Chytridiales sp. JEL 0842]
MLLGSPAKDGSQPRSHFEPSSSPFLWATPQTTGTTSSVFKNRSGAQSAAGGDGDLIDHDTLELDGVDSNAGLGVWIRDDNRWQHRMYDEHGNTSDGDRSEVAVATANPTEVFKHGASMREVARRRSDASCGGTDGYGSEDGYDEEHEHHHSDDHPHDSNDAQNESIHNDEEDWASQQEISVWKSPAKYNSFGGLHFTSTGLRPDYHPPTPVAKVSPPARKKEATVASSAVFNAKSSTQKVSKVKASSPSGGPKKAMSSTTGSKSRKKASTSATASNGRKKVGNSSKSSGKTRPEQLKTANLTPTIGVTFASPVFDSPQLLLPEPLTVCKAEFREDERGELVSFPGYVSQSGKPEQYIYSEYEEDVDEEDGGVSGKRRRRSADYSDSQYSMAAPSPKKTKTSSTSSRNKRSACAPPAAASKKSKATKKPSSSKLTLKRSYSYLSDDDDDHHEDEPDAYSDEDYSQKSSSTSKSKSKSSSNAGYSYPPTRKERNRLAAQRSREKKNQLLADLIDENRNLRREVENLRDAIVSGHGLEYVNANSVVVGAASEDLIASLLPTKGKMKGKLPVRH